jgi:hypothetical protein
MTAQRELRDGQDDARDRQACAPVAKRRPSDGRGSRRARLEDLALAALLSEPTMQQAASKAGVSESTMLRWLADPSFQARYRAARRQVVEQAVAQLQQGTSEAVETLRRNLKCGLPASEIAAAKAILDFAVKGVELVDLAVRVDALEQAADTVKEKR